jgi:hypothetical protein
MEGVTQNNNSQSARAARIQRVLRQRFQVRGPLMLMLMPCRSLAVLWLLIDLLIPPSLMTSLPSSTPLF